MPPRIPQTRSNSTTVKRQRVSLSGRSRTQAVSNAATKRQANAVETRRRQLMALVLLAHMIAKAKANRRRRPTPKGLGAGLRRK